MLEINMINVFYGDFKALWDVSLGVKEKEAVAIVGANCAGKTTLLSTISSILHPKDGTIYFSGHRIDRLPPHQIVDLGIVQIPQGRQLFPQMTVLENLDMGAVTPKAWNARKDSLEIVSRLFPILQERKDQLAGTMSGGEQQMLAIARGLMARPKLLMLDEPSLGLMPLLVREIFGFIEKMKDEGVTLLVVEQNVRQALKIADRAYVLEAGRIILEGKGEELLKDETVKKAYLGE